MAEMQCCSISSLLGISEHPDKMSNNELRWWRARSYRKPLPSVRDDISVGNQLYMSSINPNTGKASIKVSDAVRDWFGETQMEKLAGLEKRVTERQKELDKKNGKNR